MVRLERERLGEQMKGTQGALAAREWLAMLRLEMAALGRTNRQLARQLGLSDPEMSRLVNGVVPLTPEWRARLLLALHRETFDAAPHIMREFVAAEPALNAA